MGLDYVSELQPLTGLVIPQVTYEYREPRWDYIDREKQKNSKKNQFQCHFVYHKCHIDRPGHEPEPPLLKAGE
jgi:hypothetical protein